MKEFLLEIAFALMVIASFYSLGNPADAPVNSLPGETGVETAAFAQGSDLGVAISANVFRRTAPVTDLDASVPFPLPRLQRI